MEKSNEKTYEMQWDCEYCDAKKLLGKTHRHCPNCGAQQNPDKRYFPTDEEKVAVENHQYVGADKACRSCQAPNSAITKFCTNCGAAMDDAAEVNKVDDSDEQAMDFTSASSPPPTPSNKRRLGIIIAVSVLLAAIGAVIAIFLVDQDVRLTVKSQTWQREIQIERFTKVKETKWCNAMPIKAYHISRSKEIRSHEKIPDGQDCKTKRVDQKDGTFKEKQVCTTKYKKKPVYDNKCRYTIDKWKAFRSVTAKGDSKTPPNWPKVELHNSPASATIGISRLGRQRQGKRISTYKVSLAANDGKSHECKFEETKWSTFKKGSKWTGESGMLTGNVDCDSLVSASAN